MNARYESLLVVLLLSALTWQVLLLGFRNPSVALGGAEDPSLLLQGKPATPNPAFAADPDSSMGQPAMGLGEGYNDLAAASGNANRSSIRSQWWGPDVLYHRLLVGIIALDEDSPYRLSAEQARQMMPLVVAAEQTERRASAVRADVEAVLSAPQRECLLRKQSTLSTTVATEKVMDDWRDLLRKTQLLLGTTAGARSAPPLAEPAAGGLPLYALLRGLPLLEPAGLPLLPRQKQALATSLSELSQVTDDMARTASQLQDMLTPAQDDFIAEAYAQGSLSVELDEGQPGLSSDPVVGRILERLRAHLQ